MLLPLEAVASLSERTPAPENTTPAATDITDEYKGKSLIVTGAPKPYHAMSELPKSEAPGTTPRPLESYTAEEQDILRMAAKNEGKEWVEKHAHLILEQARTIGDL
jgi:hypothetical protein